MEDSNQTKTTLQLQFLLSSMSHIGDNLHFNADGFLYGSTQPILIVQQDLEDFAIYPFGIETGTCLRCERTDYFRMIFKGVAVTLSFPDLLKEILNFSSRVINTIGK